MKTQKSRSDCWWYWVTKPEHNGSSRGVSHYPVGALVEDKTKQFDNRYTYDWVKRWLYVFATIFCFSPLQTRIKTSTQESISNTWRTTRPRLDPCIRKINNTNTSAMIPWTRRQAPTSDESSDPGLSLTHHKVCQCVIHTHTHGLWKDPQASGILTTSWSGRRTIN